MYITKVFNRVKFFLYLSEKEVKSSFVKDFRLCIKIYLGFYNVQLQYVLLKIHDGLVAM